LPTTRFLTIESALETGLMFGLLARQSLIVFEISGDLIKARLPVLRPTDIIGQILSLTRVRKSYTFFR
jgi:hypothetical protein